MHSIKRQSLSEYLIVKQRPTKYLGLMYIFYYYICTFPCYVSTFEYNIFFFHINLYFLADISQCTIFGNL